MSNLNVSLANMTREELETEIICLKETNSKQLKIIEESEQHVYELKRHLATSKAMEEYLTLEIESLHNVDDQKFEKFTKKITSLEEEIHALKEKETETVQNYENMLHNKDEEMLVISDLLKTAENSANLKVTKEELEKCNDEICDLKFKISELTAELTVHEEKYNWILLKNKTSEDRNNELSTEISELKECLRIKTEELHENKELVQNLQDDATVMQMELDSLKSVPLDKASKGNSLFAEVDDNRVKLQKRMQIMNKQFAEIKVQYSNKCQELQRLHLEYATLIKEIENKTDSSDEQCELIKTYKRHFDNLTETVKSLEDEIENQKNAYVKLISGDMKCAMDMISATRSEVLTLQRKMNSESLGLAFSEQSHFETKKELKKCQREVMQLQAKFISMNQTLDDLKAANNQMKDEVTEKGKTVPIPIKSKERGSCLKSTNTNKVLFTHLNDSASDQSTDDIYYSSIIGHVEPMKLRDSFDVSGCDFENKENEPCASENKDSLFLRKEKTVSFAADTILLKKPKINSGCLGRKVFQVQAVHIPTLKKN